MCIKQGDGNIANVYSCKKTKLNFTQVHTKTSEFDSLKRKHSQREFYHVIQTQKLPVYQLVYS